MEKLLAQALVILYHAQRAHGAINQFTQLHHVVLHRYAIGGQWSNYFNYAGEQGIDTPEQSVAFACFPRNVIRII